jgi:hypothetical protein
MAWLSQPAGTNGSNALLRRLVGWHKACVKSASTSQGVHRIAPLWRPRSNKTCWRPCGILKRSRRGPINTQCSARGVWDQSNGCFRFGKSVEAPPLARARCPRNPSNCGAGLRRAGIWGRALCWLPSPTSSHHKSSIENLRLATAIWKVLSINSEHQIMRFLQACRVCLN